MTRLLSVALFSMLAASVISTMNVLCPRLSSSDAPTRVKMRSAMPIVALFARLQKPMRLGGNQIAQDQEQLVLARLALLLGRQDFLLILLQFRRDVALGILQSLLALIVGRDLGGVRVRDLDVVAEDLVEA